MITSFDTVYDGWSFLFQEFSDDDGSLSVSGSEDGHLPGEEVHGNFHFFRLVLEKWADMPHL